MKRALFLFLIAVLLSACGPIVISVETPSSQPSSVASGLPDLVISSAYLDMQGHVGSNCVSAYGPFEIRVIVEDRGQAPATNISVAEVSTGTSLVIGELGAGQSFMLYFPAASGSGTYNFVVDAQNAIPESDESNNTFSYVSPTPTPPAICTNTPLPYSTGQPTLNLTPETPIPTLPPPTPVSRSLNGLIYADMNQAQIWRIGKDGQPAAILNGISARFSVDGTQAVFEQSGDLWLSEPTGSPAVNITNTPDMLEWSPQFWLGNPGMIVFKEAGVNEAQQQGWTQPGIGYVSAINRDGTGRARLAGAPSWTEPAVSPDGKTVAFDVNGWPTIYQNGSIAAPFDPSQYGYQDTPMQGLFYTSPSFSPDGRWLTWWVARDDSVQQRTFSLVKFDLMDHKSYTLLSYTALGGTLGWLENPLWSPGGQWIAFQTRGEQTPHDLWVMHSAGGMGQRFGLATNPVWSSDNARVAFVQWPPRSDSYLSASLAVIEVPSSNTQQTSLPAGSIPLAWFGP